MSKSDGKIDGFNINLSVLGKYFSSEADAYKLVEEIRWPNGPKCPKCGVVNNSYLLPPQKTRRGKLSDRRIWRCRDCRKQFSVTVGTIFEASHIPLSKWLLAAYLLAAGKNSVSAHELHRSLGLTYKSAWFMAHRLRHAMAVTPDGSFLDGIVEADETWVGGRVRGKGKGIGVYAQNKTPVVVLVERNGKARTQALEKVDRENLSKVLSENVATSAVLMTDQYRGYTTPGRSFKEHHTVDHNRDEWVRGKAHVNTAESYFSQLKRSIDGTHHHVSKRHLQRYLYQFDFLYNERGVSNGERMMRAITGSAGKRLTYRQPIEDGGA